MTLIFFISLNHLISLHKTAQKGQNCFLSFFDDGGGSKQDTFHQFSKHFELNFFKDKVVQFAEKKTQQKIVMSGS